MDVTKDQAIWLQKTYPGMSLDDAIKAFLNDSMSDVVLLERVEERLHYKREIQAGLIVIAIIVCAFLLAVRK